MDSEQALVTSFLFHFYILMETSDDNPNDELILRVPTSSVGNSPPPGVRGVQRLPDAIIIGVKKSGTRALLEFLRAHPDVRAPGPEIHFFDKYYDKGLDWYRSRMPHVTAEQLTIEKTPSYFITRPAPQRIFNMSSTVRLIVVVRDPVTRALSDYTQAISKRPGLGSFERRAFVDREAGLVDTSWGVVKIGLYARHLQRWLRHFPLDRIHFVHGERLVADPGGELARVQDFLGLRRLVTDDHFYFNSTKGFPCLRRQSPHCLGKTKGRTHPAVDPVALTRLREFYRPFNAKFYQMTGIDFGWS